MQDLEIFITTNHLSDREKALRAIYGDSGSEDALFGVYGTKKIPLPAELKVTQKVDKPKSKFIRTESLKPYKKQKSASLTLLLAK